MNNRAKRNKSMDAILCGCCDKNMHGQQRNTNSQNRQHAIIMPPCYCTFYDCKGQIVDDKTRKRHQRMDFSEEFHKVCQYIGFA